EARRATIRLGALWLAIYSYSYALSQCQRATRSDKCIARNVVHVSCCTIPVSMSMDQGVISRTNTHRDRQVVLLSPYTKQYVEQYHLVRLGIRGSLAAILSLASSPFKAQKRRSHSVMVPYAHDTSP
ncbi:hypothetical protein CCMA1212_002573, partial [Trichoderma ghanense]